MIGTTEKGRKFTLPPDVQTTTTAVLGIRGSGKSHTASVNVENLLDAGAQVVILDPTNVWYGLRSSADGKRAGFEVMIIGGSHGDIPLAAGDGEVIADFVVEHPISVVISLRHLPKAQQRKFVTAFAAHLYFRKGEDEHRSPLLMVIDECDTFVPQQVGGAEAVMVGAIEDLVRRGRSAGIGVMLISQRAASVNKDVLTQIELLVAHRHTSPQDRKALQAWVEAHDTNNQSAQFMADLASLPRGTAYFWSPGWLNVFEKVQVRQRKTFDSSFTPKAGEKGIVPVKRAEIDLDALKGKLADTIEKAKADDPKLLREKIAALERDLKAERSKPAPKSEPEIRVEKVPYVPEGLIEAVEQIEEYLQEVKDQIAAVDLVHGQQAAIDSRARLDAPKAPVLRTSSAPAAPIPAPRPQTPPRPASAAPAPSGSLAIGPAAVLTVCCQYPEGATRPQITILTGYKRSTRDAYIQRLSQQGLVEVQGALIVAASGAQAHLPNFEPLPTGKALQDYWLGRLPEGEAKILAVLINARGNPVSRDHISQQTDYQRSTRDAYIQRMSAKLLVETVGRGEVKASGVLFE